MVNLSAEISDFLEGKKAWDTYTRKSTPRTLKEIGQQYHGRFRDTPALNSTLAPDTSCCIL
jgi:hypothetical protein